jgi:hypothetical protein
LKDVKAYDISIIFTDLPSNLSTTLIIIKEVVLNLINDYA